jgi:hypothetical protein
MMLPLRKLCLVPQLRPAPWNYSDIGPGVEDGIPQANGVSRVGEAWN